MFPLLKYFHCTVKIPGKEKIGSGSEVQLVKALQTALSDLPDVQIQSVEHHVMWEGVLWDLQLHLLVQGRPARIVVETRKTTYPRDLLLAVRQWQRLRHAEASSPVVALVAAPAVSPGGRKLLREEGLGYWDLGGSLYLKLPWALYFIDLPAPRVGGRERLDLYRGNAAQVLHTLLLEPEREWHVQELAVRAEVALSRVHRTLSALEEQLWVEKRGRGPQAVRLLRDPGALLDAWATHWDLSRYEFRDYHRWAQTPQSLRQVVAETLGRLEVEYALTLTSGADLVAPFATGSERLTVLIPSILDLDMITSAAGLKAVDEGGNVSFLVSRDRSPLLFRRCLGGIWVASNVQLYLDLASWPARGKEQARHLRAEQLPY